MVVSFAVGLRAFCVAMGLLWAVAYAAEPSSPLIGATREQVLSRYGEPKSQIATGNRIVMFYARERLVLRDNVVIEVEPISAEPTRRPEENPPPEPTSPGANPSATTPATDRDRSTGRTTTTPTQPAPDSKVQIKIVNPPSKDARPSSPTPKSTPITKAPEPVAPILPSNPAPDNPVVPALPETTTKKVEEPAPQTEVVTKEDPKQAKKAADEADAKKKKEQAIRDARRRLEQATATDPEPVISSRTYLMALAVLVGGIAILIWRYRQRQLELAATSVSNTPLTSAPAAPVFSGNGFTAEFLNSLEWKKFEELVAAYYSKTGVVAVRTKTGPDSPVHIKISWKGEPRPFAYVQCVAHPAGLVERKSLEALVAALAADDIRRGYVVTSGKFNVQARDYAEEKHITLLPGDIFLEKLNALPSSARTEIMQAVATVDAAVPTCPKCDAKMVRSSDDPPVWRCPNHPDQVVPIKR